MENNPVQNNAVIFWIGLVVAFVGLAATAWYLFGPQLHVKHAILTFLVATGGAVLASFSRPRPPVSSTER